MTMKASREKPALRVTRDYSLFEQHEFNRPLHRDPSLEASMKKYGFLRSGAIHCIRAPSGKLKILQGHHRFEIARKFELPIWYIITDSAPDIFYMESCRSRWTCFDFAYARARAGDKDCRRALEVSKKHGTPLSITSALLRGSVSNGGANEMIARGTFKVLGESFSTRVLSIIDSCVAAGVLGANRSSFIRAIALACCLKEFDEKIFLQRVRLHHGELTVRASYTDCLTEIEEIYNWNSKRNRIALKFMALEGARKRSAETRTTAKTSHAHGLARAVGSA